MSREIGKDTNKDFLDGSNLTAGKDLGDITKTTIQESLAKVLEWAGLPKEGFGHNQKQSFLNASIGGGGLLPNLSIEKNLKQINETPKANLYKKKGGKGR